MFTGRNEQKQNRYLQQSVLTRELGCRVAQTTAECTNNTLTGAF